MAVVLVQERHILVLLAKHLNCFFIPESQFKIKLISGCSISSLKHDYRFKIWLYEINKNGFSINLDKLQNLSGVDRFIYMIECYTGKSISNSCIVIDHTPSNIKDSLEISNYFTPFEKYFVHIIRDGRAIASSFKLLDWGPTNSIESALFWLQNLTIAFNIEIISRTNFIRVFYEDLILNHDNTLSVLISELNLSSCKKPFSNVKIADYTSNQHNLVLQPPCKKRSVIL